MKRNVLDLIRADHASVRRLLDLLDEAACGPAERRQLVAKRLQDVVAEHVAAEERTVYVALPGDGEDREVLGALQEHTMIRALLWDLASMPPEGHHWLSRAGELRRLLERHMRREETTVLPAVRSVAPDQLEGLAERFMPAPRRQRGGE